jgi:hypothetical protein
MPFNKQASLKVRGHVLMTKFGKSRKTRVYGLGHRLIRFEQFHEDLKIQVCLKNKKGK